MRGQRPDIGFATTDELVALAASGDRDAFARLVRLHGEAVTRVAWLVTGNMPAAVVAARAAWVLAWPGLRKPRQPADLEAWVARLAASEAVRMVHQAVEGVAVPGSPEWTGESALPLEVLAPPERALLALHHLAGITPDDLDRITGRPTGATATRLPELWAAIGADAVSARSQVAAMADVPIRPIDADAIARIAAAEEGEERIRIASVVIGTVAGVTVLLFPVIARVLSG